MTPWRLCPARPHADIMKRRAAVGSDTVVPHQDVDSPPVKKGGRRPDAFADEDSRFYALEHAYMQARSAARIAQLDDITVREPELCRIGRINEHLGSLLAR